jgi:hypothetical protein
MIESTGVPVTAEGAFGLVGPVGLCPYGLVMAFPCLSSARVCAGWSPTSMTAAAN